MSILLYAAGAIVLAIGAALVAFGIPINEFSFGNTLIIAGTTAMVGGLILFGLGVVVRELRHVGDAFAQAPGKVVRAVEADAPMPPRLPPTSAARVPFPPKPKAVTPRSDSAPHAAAAAPFDEFADEPPAAFEPPSFDKPAPRSGPDVFDAPLKGLSGASLKPVPVPASFQAPLTPAPVTVQVQPRLEDEVFGAPALPNPDEAPASPEDDQPPAPQASEEAELPPFEPRLHPELAERDDAADEVPEPKKDSYFDAMWPAEPRSAERDPFGRKPAFAHEERVAEEADRGADEAEPGALDTETGIREEPRSVPILKSGVVDGMGYTLYVDGSIEAELPTGTLRFASINELRAHLERTG